MDPVEADVMSRSLLLLQPFYMELYHVGGVEVLDNVYATGIMATCSFAPLFSGG